MVESSNATVNQMSEKLDPEFLSQYVRESEWAKAHGICQRTVARYRDRGLPYLMFAGYIWIPKHEAHEWIASRVKRRNTGRRRTTATQEAAAK
jgi:hypothetical protein